MKSPKSMSQMIRTRKKATIDHGDLMKDVTERQAMATGGEIDDAPEEGATVRPDVGWGKVTLIPRSEKPKYAEGGMVGGRGAIAGGDVPKTTELAKLNDFASKRKQRAKKLTGR